jgi:hypothetical protein
MRELLRTNDLVLLSYASHVLGEAGITSFVFDSHMSALEGSIGALPRRLMVEEDEYLRARRVLDGAAISGSLSDAER